MSPRRCNRHGSTDLFRYPERGFHNLKGAPVLAHRTMTARNERKESSMNTKCGYEHQWLTKLSKRGVGGAVALLLLLPLAAWAGGVVTNCTETALRAAMAGGGVVTFACDGTITLASTITNENDTALDGSGHNVTISGS